MARTSTPEIPRSGSTLSTPPQFSASRSYRKGVEYRYYREFCGATTTGYIWEPYSETGGTGHNDDISRPDWTKCAQVDKGDWYRNSSGGTAYSYSAAVKFASMIGIDLYAKRQYSSSNKIHYVVTGTNKQLCGNNGEWSSVSGKMMMKFTG